MPATGTERFLALDVDGRRVRFSENVFDEYAGPLLVRVWSVVDRAALERQLPNRP